MPKGQPAELLWLLWPLHQAVHHPPRRVTALSVAAFMTLKSRASSILCRKQNESNDCIAVGYS